LTLDCGAAVVGVVSAFPPDDIPVLALLATSFRLPLSAKTQSNSKMSG